MDVEESPEVRPPWTRTTVLRAVALAASPACIALPLHWSMLPLGWALGLVATYPAWKVFFSGLDWNKSPRWEALGIWVGGFCLCGLLPPTGLVMVPVCWWMARQMDLPDPVEDEAAVDRSRWA